LYITSKFVNIIVIIKRELRSLANLHVIKDCIKYDHVLRLFDLSVWRSVWRVVEFRRVCGDLLSKCRQWVLTWRNTGREWVPGLGDSRGLLRRGDANAIDGAKYNGFSCFTNDCGIEQNPGPVVEVENTVRLLCTGCGKNLKSGIQCGLCGLWYH